MTDFISRNKASALVPEEVADEIIQSAITESAVLGRMRRLRNMTRKEERLPVLTLFPEAYFVSELSENGEGTQNGDSLKQTTKARWNNKYIRAEELAVIVPVPENVLDDSDYDIWGEIQPRIVEAIGRKVDRAVIWGENAPGDWPTSVLASCIAAGNAVNKGTNVDLYGDILGENGAVAKMEEAGYMPNGWLAQMLMRSKLRSIRDENNQLLFHSATMQESVSYALDGFPIGFPRNGSFIPTDSGLLFGFDWDQFVFSVRSDMQVKITDDAVISDSDGTVLINLFQQDMVAMRVTFRLGWQVANPPNRLKPDTEDQAKASTYVGNPERYPACVVLKEGSYS